MTDQTISVSDQNLTLAGRQRFKKLPRLLFAAPQSGSGKTVITCAILDILKRWGLSCVSFKCGPDYIDPMFHRYVLGVPSYNLDSFFLPPDQVTSLFAEKSRGADMAVIEGVMGYYDGVAGVSTQASAYHIACLTDTPVVLIVDGKNSSLSLAATVKGFLDYARDSHIRGVILNRTSAAVAERLRPHLESLGVGLFGAVPQCQEAALESRHLGLTLPGEQARLRENLEVFSHRLESCLDIDGLLELAAEAPPVDRRGEVPKPPGDTRTLRRIAVARDEAFCFYYQDNLDFLEENGWELVPFSPLHDHRLPCAGISAILLGGGYPEEYAKELSANQTMLSEIRMAHSQGVKLLAECGGFLYLHETLEGADGRSYPMVSLIKAHGYRTGKLSRFGYITLSDRQGHPLGRGHEFHYWDSTRPGEDARAAKPQSSREWNCMYITSRMIAGFPHLYYRSNPRRILEFLGGNDHENDHRDI